jgi:hypothetical protein
LGSSLQSIFKAKTVTSIPDHIKIKLENATGFLSKIKETCLVHIDSPKEEYLKRISVYLGDMAHSLRSALNNAMWDFCENKIKIVVPEDEYDKIKYSHDFPIESDSQNFETNFEKAKPRVLRYIAANYSNVYHFLEKAQPYHKEYRFLTKIQVFSNDTSHTIPVKVQDVGEITQIIIPGFSPPVIHDDQVIVQWSNKHPATSYPIPSYVDEMEMYISSDKKWKKFLTSIDETAFFSPTPFSKNTPRKVSDLITEFYTLW